MARIISSRKKYVPVKDLVVYPSKTETIEVIPDDGFNGAHRYRARMCAGFVNGKTKYVDATDTIQFVHKHEDGTITPGWAGKDAGNPWLADEIMRKQPDYCFCGHIHSGNHELQEITGIHLANVSLVGEDYNIHYEPLYLNI